MTNAHRKNNSLDKIKINGVWLTKEQDVREGVANAYHQMLSENAEWKADIGGLQLDHPSLQEAENSKLPFSEEEVRFALMEMNGYNLQARWLHIGFLARLLELCEGGGYGNV